MAIDAQHEQYIKYYPKWKMINDIVDIENLDSYLVYLNKFDTSQENKERNETYKERAVFYALVSMTLTGTLGLIYSKKPRVDLPSSLEYLQSNIDGRGNSIYQQSKSVLKKVTSISRAGLYTSFPIFDREVSKAEINSGMAVATIQHIEADRIINWQETSYGAVRKLSLIVFHDTESEVIDYETETTETIRELFLDNGVYKQRIWTKPKDKWIPGAEIIPRDKNGNAFNEILFKFVGSENNDADCDNPNYYAMTKLNIAHFRNSADYEDSVWFVGQAQPWMSGVKQDHIDLMTENNMYNGSRQLLAVPDGGSYGIASAPPNTMVRQAMLDKVDMMISLGAQQITPGGVAKTAEQSRGERETKHSVTTTAIVNVNDAYLKSIQWCSQFMNGSESEIDFAINMDFISPNASTEELKEIILGFMSSAVPVGDYIRYMKKQEIFDENKSDDDYTEELTQSSAFNLDE